MKRYILLFSLLSSILFVQCRSIYHEYSEIAFSRQLKTELNLVEEINEDTVYALWINATVHNSDEVFPNILWYHQGDSIVAYSINTFHKKRYVILDTISSFPLGKSQHLECFDKGGWDLLHVYAGKTLIKSTVIDQECLLKIHPENELEMHLQHDITLLREQIPDFYKYRVDADNDVSEGH